MWCEVDFANAGHEFKAEIQRGKDLLDMAGMGDLQAVGGTDLARRLKALEAVRDQSTLDEYDMYVPSPREAELAARVCVDDCIVALGSDELRRQLCLTVIEAVRPALAVILGHRIGEDDDFLDYLRIFLPVQVRVLSSPSAWSMECFKGVCLMEPGDLWTLLTSGVIRRKDMGVVVFQDFENYLDPCHPYHDITECLLAGRKRKESKPTRVLALTDDLKAGSLDGLELKLKRLRTPLRLTCCLGTPERPHSKGIDVQVHLLRIDWTAEVGKTVSSSDDPDVQEIGTTLREWGIVAARSRAKRTVAAKPRAELQAFLLKSQRILTRLKGEAIVQYLQGRTLALTTTVASQRNIKEWIRNRPSITVIDQPDEVALSLSVVLVATTADVPTLKRYCWDAVILCDLPYGISCDALLASADRKVVLATEIQHKHWKAALELHDDLEALLLRVNQ